MSSPASSQPSGNSSGLDRELLMVASVVVLGAIMSILDVTVVNVAINTLAPEFHTDLPTIQWVATGYTLALATVIPLTGWAADRFGTKRLYMISLALFVMGSVLSGLAWSSGSLIFFRVLQGFGGGMIIPPPRPWRMRKKISDPADHARPDSTEPTRKSARLSM